MFCFGNVANISTVTYTKITLFCSQFITFSPSEHTQSLAALFIFTGFKSIRAVGQTLWAIDNSINLISSRLLSVQI